MIQFVCDWCSRVKKSESAGEGWILGTAAEAVATTAARREVTILSSWDRLRVVDPLAVHFCSVECKDNYMAQLFAPRETVEEVLVERTVPAEVVVERTIPRRKRVVTKTQRRKRAA
jgi:hypothetical protein